MDFSIIIPVYNEKKTVKQVIEKVKKVRYPGKTEIIVIDDGSTDNSLKILKSIKGITLLKNHNNKGKGYSLRRAFKSVKGDIIIIQDADLEYNPADHLKLIKVLEKNNEEVVYGSRFINRRHAPRYKLFYIGNIFLSFLTRMLYSKNITDMETCYKAFRRSVLHDIKLTANRFDFEPEITCKLLKRGYRIVEVPISYKSRSYAEGKKIGIKDGIKAILVLFRYRFSD